MQLSRVPTGSVYRRDGARRPVWYARYRLPDGREVRRRIGPAWIGRGRPAAGFYTRQSAEAWLADVLGEARRGTLPGMVRTGATFADAAAEYLRYIEHDRGRKRSTLFDYESILKTHVLPAFGQRRLEDITTAAIEGWLADVSLRRWRDRPLTERTRNKIIVVLHGIFRRACKVWSLPLNPVAQVERFPERPSGDIDVFSAEEIHALVRATPDAQDAAMFAAAAFTGLRMGELRALRWRDVDFVRCVVRVRGSYAMGELTTPKSGKVRSVPLIDVAARLLAVLAQRPRFAGDDDLVFGDEFGGWISDDRIRRRYAAAQLRSLRFHDLRHTFGSLAITRADIVEVQAWMGHADIKTTMRYLHYRDRGEAARRLGEAFSVGEPASRRGWALEDLGNGTEPSVQAGPAGLR